MYIPARSALRGSLVLGFTLLLAACGPAKSPAGAPSGAGATATPANAATPVPPELVQYAAAVKGTLQTTLDNANSLLTKMQSSDVGSLAIPCSDAGENFANQQQSFQTINPPASAGQIPALASTGYQIVLSATTECGMAADSVSAHQMYVASQDLDKGLKDLGRAEDALTRWAAATH